MQSHPLRPALFIAAVLATASAWAQAPSEPPASVPATAPAGLVTRDDKAFLLQAAHGSFAEVESGELAQTRAQNDKVKAFAKQVASDHARLIEELTALAALKGVDVPERPSVAQKGKLKWLQALDGARFDRRYVDQFGIKAHETAVTLFETTARRTRDGEIKAFAEKTLPELRHHLQLARELKAAGG